MPAQGSHLSFDAVTDLVHRRGSTPLWIEDNRVVTWNQFGAHVEEVRSLLQGAGVEPGEVVVTPGEAALESIVWLFAVASVGGVVAPLRPERRTHAQAWKTFLKIGWRVEEGRLVRESSGEACERTSALLHTLRERAHPGLILATGGTSGTPKVVLHDLVLLGSTIPVRNAERPLRILPLLKFDHIGGLDAVWRALAAGHCLVCPPVEFSIDAVAAAIERHTVEVLPATPSFLNLLMLGNVRQERDLTSLRTVPYGAEPMSAALLVRLRSSFPNVDFVERFGTSETGALPVSSTAEGLVLREASGRFDWKVVEGELWIKSPAQALGYLSGGDRLFDSSGWFRTGDLAQYQGDRSIRVLGRKVELINVGGEKVLPASVESALLEHPCVADCRVSGSPNAVLGQVVVADLVWTGPENDPLEVKKKLHDFVAALLPKSHLPVVVRLVGSIDSTDNLKKSRRPCL